MALSKLQTALARCERTAQLSGGAVLVALSGGKDSLVTLEVCKATFAHVEAFYMYHVKGLQCVERSVDAAARRCGVRVHKVPHPDLTRIMRSHILRPFTAEAADVKLLKQADVEKALTARTGIEWFAYGERAADSFARRLYTRKDDGVRADWKRVYPIWDWLHGDVVGYLKQRKIALPERLGANDTKVMSGFALRPRPLHWMKHHAPDDYARVLEVFPYAEAMVFRYELEQANQAAVPERKREPKPKRGRSLKAKLGARGGDADEVPEVRDPSGTPQ